MLDPLRRVVSTVLVVAGLAAVCAVHLAGKPLPGYGLGRSADEARQQSTLAQLDRLALSATAGGNAFLQFRGMDGSLPQDEPFMAMAYYRTVHAAYPARVFVARPSDVVNNGLGITRAAFAPDGTWLRSHGVRSVVTFSKDRTGIHMSLQRIAPADAGTGGTGQGADPQGGPGPAAVRPGGGGAGPVR
jgi:hypothetical protein